MTGLSEYWKRYKAWLTGLERGARLRWRVLQAAAVIVLLVGVGYAALDAWIEVPDVPDIPVADPGETGTSSGSGEMKDEVSDAAKSGRREGCYTFLVAGRDTLTGATDTMMLFTFDSVKNTLDAVSLPRDTMINTKAASKRLNAVFGRNRGSSDLSAKERAARGMTALKQEVNRLSGIYPDFYVLVEWKAVGELVDALGGVEFDVPYDMHYDDPEQDLYIHQEKGLRVLNGDDAMQVIRWRKNNGDAPDIQIGDTGRMKIQQDFLMAVLRECLEPATLLKIPTLAQVFLDNVKTDLTIGNLLAFAQMAAKLDMENGVHFHTAPYTGVSYRKASMVLLKKEEWLELLNGGLNPYVEAIEEDDLQLLYQNKDGSFAVTNGELADPAMAQGKTNKPEPKPAEPEKTDPPEPPEDEQPPEEEPEAPEQEEPPVEAEPETPPEGDVPPAEEQQPAGSLGEIDPDTVLPDPEEDPQEEQDNTVALLPSRPEPVEPAA